MFTVETEPEIQTPDVYRSTPYEHFSTADPGESVVVLGVPVASGHTWIVSPGTVLVRPVVPVWMGVRLVAKSTDPFDLAFPEA